MSDDSPIFEVREPAEGADAVPLLVSIPHTGTELSEGLAERLVDDEVRALPDTDWHLHRLYDFVPELGARTIYARYSRYVVDLNRPADGHALYPGRHETGLVPTADFDGKALYRPGAEPDDAERAARTDRYWRPYHAAIESELSLLRAQFGYALLFDAHSIRSEVPQFAEGALPGLMLGDADGSSADPSMSRAVLDVHHASGLGSAHNAPFKGGWITRCFGRPAEHVHALQLEMSQRLYMVEGPPFAWSEERAEALRPWLRRTLGAFVEAAAQHYRG